MKTYQTFLLLFLTMMITTKSFSQTINKNYDSVLAKKLGADDYGMKMYVLAILKTGTSNDTSKIVRDSVFAGHMKNINRLAKEGKLVTAGPLENNGNNYRGIYIFNVSTLEDGRKLVATDPAIVSEFLDFDLYLLYGSAAYTQLPDLHNKLAKYEF